MEKLKVLVRIRPFLRNENESNTGFNINSQNCRKIEISKSVRKFEATFDKILPQNSTQTDVFDFIKPCISYIKKGINCTVLAYGQTGSGKTYTMFGGEWAMNDQSYDYENRKKFHQDKYNFILNEELLIDPFSKSNGIIPNLVMNLFQIYDSLNSNIIITCSYIQIYNEKVYDLLVDEEIDKEEKKQFNLIYGVGRNVDDKPISQKPLKIKYDPKNGVTIEGVNEVRTPTFYDIFELLRQGEINRKIRQTTKNEMSSRSHTIFIINIKNLKTKVVSKIKLCDLAGSEKYDSRGSYQKVHLNELCNINKSLLILGNVIHTLGTANSYLSFNSTDKNKKKSKIFAPYKDSKLTQILEDSLGGNSMTYLIATISPSDDSFDETISTLKFADRANSIMSKVSMNQLSNDNEYSSKEFNKVVEELSQLKQLLNIRRKRGTLEPIQEEILKLKDENYQLKKCLGGGKNINRIQELLEENTSLRKEIKNLKDVNKNLRIEINSKSVSHISSDISNNNPRYNSLGKNKQVSLYNNKLQKNIYSLKGSEELLSPTDSKSRNILNSKKYNFDDVLNTNQETNKISTNMNSLYKNYVDNNHKKSNKAFLESGQNIVYGSTILDDKKDENENKTETENNNLNNLKDDDLYINENDDKDLLNNKINNQNLFNKKNDQINNLSDHYERLKILDDLEMDNKIKAQKLIDDLTKNQNQDDIV